MSRVQHVLSLGAGVQSSTLAVLASEGHPGIVKPAFGIFADTQAEPKAVYEWLELLRTMVDFPIHVITAGDIAEAELTLKTSKKTGKVYRKQGMPAFVRGAGMLPRTCTADFKVRPIIRELRTLCDIPRGCKELRVIQQIGISTDEAHRMKPSQTDWIEHEWPLIDIGMSRQDCLDWWKERNLPQPPRSACVMCPFHSNAEWRRLRDEDPEGWERAAEFEVEMQAASAATDFEKGVPFLHTQRKPLKECDIDDPEAEQLDLWGNECEGMCGL